MPKKKSRPHLIQRRSRSARVEPLERRQYLSVATDDEGALLVDDAEAFRRAAQASDNWSEAPSAAPAVKGPISLESMTVSQAATLTARTGLPVMLDVVGGTASTGRQPTGALTGKIVYTVGGHGFTAYSGGWHTQRGEVSGTEMVEDLGNQDQMTFYVNYLFNAGATVVPLRPVGYQPNEVVLDNDSPGVTFTGTWNDSVSTQFYGSAGDVPYRYADTAPSETATARYTPTITVAGLYPVYAWSRAGSDRVNQTYRVVHPGGTTTVQIDHRRVGSGWVYLGSYFLNPGTSAYVEISNQSPTADSVVIADAIRFGNGMGDIDRGLGVSGQTRSDESALYWIESQKGQGVDDSVFRGTLDTDDNDNVSAPPRWAAWMNRETAGTNTERIFLSFHSNATGVQPNTSTRGTLGLYNGNNRATAETPHQQDWAQLLGSEVTSDLVALSPKIEFPWANNSTVILDRSDIEFGEINNEVIGDEFDASILEVGYHDNASDAADLRDPKVRDWVARAALQATIKYFRQFNAQPTLALPPEAPTNVRAEAQSNGGVKLSWNAPVVDSASGDAATGYAIYQSVGGQDFALAGTVNGGGTLTFTIPSGQLAGSTYFRVAATNAGGESMPSETLAARFSGSTAAKVLLVQGFDRMARTLDPTQTTPLDYDPPFAPGSGNTFDRVRPRFSNSYDYLVRAGDAIKAYAGGSVAFDSTSNEALIAGQVSLNNYAAVIWLSGEESTADDTFNATEQTLVTNYLGIGGRLFVSGSEIGWDLDAQAGGASFYNNLLKADYAGDDADSYTASGAAGSIFSGVSLTFDDGTQGTYNVDFPDKLTALGGSTIAMNYTGTGTGGAAIQYANATTGAKVVNFGFPFETITTTAARNQVMSAVLNYFALGNSTVSGTAWQDYDDDNVQDAGEPVLPGVTVALWLKFSSNGYSQQATTTSDADGKYWFPNAAASGSTYQVTSFANNYAALTDAVDLPVARGVPVGNNQALFPTIFNGTANADQYYVRANAANTRLEISLGNAPLATPTYQARKVKVYQIGLHLGGGDDALTVDFSNGTPTAGGYVDYFGDANGTTAGDSLRVIGSANADHLYVQGSNYHIDYSAGGFVSSTSQLNAVERVTIDAGGGDDVMDVYSGAPTVTFNGQTSTAADTLNLNSGVAMTFAGDASVGTTNLALVVNSGASATFGATQHLKSLTVSGSATLTSGGSKVIVAQALSVPGTLDLTDNDVIVNYSAATPGTTLFNQVKAGRAGGTWTGIGIQSSSAGSSGLRGLGIGEASDVLGLTGSQTALWNGQTVDATSVLIKYTYVGDADLNGKINGDDYFRIDSHVAAQSFGYAAGDFDYNNKIDGDDYFRIDSNLPAQTGVL